MLTAMATSSLLSTVWENNSKSMYHPGKWTEGEYQGGEEETE